MKKNIYKFLKFINQNKFIFGSFFVFAFTFLFYQNTFAKCSGINPACWLDEGIGTIFIAIATFFIAFASWIFGLMFNIFINITSPLLTFTPIVVAWKLIRDIVNMFFIFFLLFASIAKLIGQEKRLKQKNATTQIIYILISAFLINFSKVICGVVIDFTQIITLQFTNSFVDSLKNLDSIFSIPEGATPSVLLGIIFIIFALAFLAVSLTAVLYILIRAISLAIYTALSPVWFLWLSFPVKNKGVEQIKSNLLDKFFQLAVGGPILGFYLWLSLMLINPGSDGDITSLAEKAGPGISTEDVVPQTKGGIDTTSAKEVNGAYIMKMIIGVAVLLFAQKEAMKLAKEGGSVMGKGLMDGVVNKVGALGMKPLDSVKSIAQDTLGGARDLASGGIKNGINFARKGNNFLSKGLDSALRLGEDMSKNSIERGSRIAKRASQAKALNDAYAIKDPIKREVAIKAAQKDIDKRQIENASMFHADAQAAGGYGNFFAQGVKKRAVAIGVTGAAILGAGTFGLGPAAIAAAGALGSSALGIGGLTAAGAGKLVFDGANRKKKAEKEKKRLEELRDDMNNPVNKSKFRKENFAQVTAQIEKQDAIIKAEKERQKLDDYRKANTENGRQQLEQERNSINIIGLENQKNALNRDYEKKKNEGASKKELKKINSEINEVNKQIEKQKNRKKELDDLVDKDTGLVNTKTKDEVKKQEAAYVKAEANIGKKEAAYQEIRKKAAGISDPPKENEKQKSFNTAKDKIKEENGGWELDKNAEMASKINAIGESSSENKIAAMMLKLDNGAKLKEDEKNWLEKHEKEFTSVVAQLDKDTIEKINKNISDGKLGKINQVTPKSKDYLENTYNQINSSIESYIEDYLSSVEEEFKDNGGKDHDFVKLLNERIAGIKTKLDTAKSDGDGFSSVEDEIEKLKKLTTVSRGNKAFDPVALKKSNITLEEANEFRETRKKDYVPQPTPSANPADLDNKESGLKVDISYLRKVLNDFATSLNSNNKSSSKDNISNLVNSNTELSSYLGSFAQNFTSNSNNLITTTLDLVSEIKDKEQRDFAMAVIMEKLIGNIDNLESARSVVSNSLENDQNSEDIFNAYDKAEQNIISKDKAQKEEEENLQDYLDNGFSRS